MASNVRKSFSLTLKKGHGLLLCEVSNILIYDSHLKLVPQILESGLQYPTLRINVRDTEHQNGPAQMVVEIDTLRDLKTKRPDFKKDPKYFTTLSIWSSSLPFPVQQTTAQHLVHSRRP